jgi:hypothetical protein
MHHSAEPILCKQRTANGASVPSLAERGLHTCVFVEMGVQLHPNDTIVKNRLAVFVVGLDVNAMTVKRDSTQLMNARPASDSGTVDLVSFVEVLSTCGHATVS